MSLSDTDVKAEYQGAGAIMTAAIPFVYDAATEVIVIERDESVDPVTETTLTNPTDYTIVGANIVTVASVDATSKILVIRSNPLTQATDFVGTGELQVESIEDALDKLTKIVQEQGEALTRCLKIPKTYPTTLISDAIVPDPVAGQSFKYDDTAEGFDPVTLTDDGTQSVLVTKGQIPTYDTDIVALDVGSDGQVLTADSNQTKGIKWATPTSTLTIILPKDSWQILGGGPTEAIENNVRVFKFGDGLTQQIATVVKVPQAYVAGAQLTMRVHTYSASAANTNKMQSVTTLIRPGTTAITSTTNQRTSTNAAVTLASANRVEVHALDLTDGTGQINSVAIAAGDIILVVVSRDTATDTDTADVKMLADSAEVS